MAVYSMTGYALLRVPASAPDGVASGWVIELRSVNSRYLDLSFRLADALRVLEPQLRERVARHCKRGKIDLRISQEQSCEVSVAVPDRVWLQQLQQVQATIHSHLPAAPALSVADVLRLYASSAPAGDNTDAVAQASAAALLVQFDAALQALQHSRALEGARLVAAMRERLERVAQLARDATTHVSAAIAQQQEKFLQRWQQALDITQRAYVKMGQQGGAAGTGAAQLATVTSEALQERALSEMAAYAIRVDVAEELDRLQVHVQSLLKLMQQGGEVGKKMEFLIQELHREANTLGSKASVLALSQVALDMKVIIEQLREQVQNIA